MRVLLTSLLSCLALPLCAIAQDTPEFHWRAYAQLTAEHLGGIDDTFAFGADRIRPRFEVDAGRLAAVAQFDLAVKNPSDRHPGTLTNAIMDLNVAFGYAQKHGVVFGQFKTPLGMDYNVPAGALDITKRGLDLALVLNRAFGVMLSGKAGLEGLSYDIGLFNPAGLSPATQYVDEQVGQDTTPVARLRFDRANWHAELAHGIGENAGGPGTSDYAVTDLAMRYTADAWTFKSEWIDARNVRGDVNWDATMYYIHGSYRLSPMLELVARRYDGTSSTSGESTDLRNTFLGFTWHFGQYEKLDTRLQVNYVFAGGDLMAYTGVRGFRGDAVFVQLQVLTSN
jgi:hypothetical protein